MLNGGCTDRHHQRCLLPLASRCDETRCSNLQTHVNIGKSRTVPLVTADIPCNSVNSTRCAQREQASSFGWKYTPAGGSRFNPGAWATRHVWPGTVQRRSATARTAQKPSTSHVVDICCCIAGQLFHYAGVCP